METATIIVIFVSSLLLGITTYSIYTAFGPTSKNLRDPFEEHEDQKIKPNKLVLLFSKNSWRISEEYGKEDYH